MAAIDDDERQAMADVVEKWGYPRGIGPDEVALGLWLAYGRHCVVLMMPNIDPEHLDTLDEGSGPIEVALHICIEPEYRSRLSARGCFNGLRAITEACYPQLKRIIAEPIGPDAAKCEQYLERLGYRVEEYDTGSRRWVLRIEEF